MSMQKWTKMELYWDPLPIRTALWTVDSFPLDIGSSDLDEEAKTDGEMIDDRMTTSGLLTLGAAPDLITVA